MPRVLSPVCCNNRHSKGVAVRHTGGAVYLYRGGTKFQLQLTEIGDRMIDAIPNASDVEWGGLFTGQPGVRLTFPQPVPRYL